jgi:hypothetical protein
VLEDSRTSFQNPFILYFTLIAEYREQHPTFADTVCSSLISSVLVEVVVAVVQWIEPKKKYAWL